MQTNDNITSKTNAALQFSIVYEQYYALAMNYAMQRLPCPGLAEDVVQEVFIKIWEKGKHKGAIANWKRYLFILVRNAACTYLRQQQLRLRLQTEKIRRENQHTTHDALLEKEIRTALQAAIEKMPTKRRKVYQLSFEFRHSSGENAESGENTVKNQLSESRQEVREHLCEMAA